MKEINTVHLHRTFRAEWDGWKYEEKAMTCDKDLFIVGIDLNCELCGYAKHYVNESATYAEVSLSEEWQSDGSLLRAHAVYVQSALSIPRPSFIKRKFSFGHQLFHAGNSGMLTEGWRTLMFPEGTGVKIGPDRPLYIHIQSTGYVSIGIHCTLYCCN